MSLLGKSCCVLLFLSLIGRFFIEFCVNTTKLMCRYNDSINNNFLFIVMFVFLVIGLATGGTEDNEVASQHERNSWLKKWRLPQLFNSQQPIPKDSPPPPSWSKAYVIQLSFYNYA